MDIIELMTRSGTYVLALAVFVVTWFTRKVVELAVPTWKKQADANSPDITYTTMLSRWWNEVILYALPVVYGALFSLIPSDFLFPSMDGGSRVFFGVGMGWLSSYLYKALKKTIKGKLGIELPSSSTVTGV